MEHESSYNNQLRKEITAKAVMNKKIKMLEADIDENNKKKYMMQILKIKESKELYLKESKKIEIIPIFL